MCKLPLLVGVLTRLHLGHEALELSASLALGEIGEVVVHGGDFDEPVGLDVRHRPNVILRGQHELVVEDPLRFVVQTGGRVQLNHLVILHGQVMTSALQMSHLRGTWS